MWDLPGPGVEPVSPALAGRFLTTAPPGKPYDLFYFFFIWLHRVLTAAHGIFIVASGLFIMARMLLSSCGVWAQ